MKVYHSVAYRSGLGWREECFSEKAHALALAGLMALIGREVKVFERWVPQRGREEKAEEN